MLKLKKEDYEKILDHCRKGLPNESCGLLGGIIEGDVKTIEKVYLLTNIDESNEHFSMDLKEQLSAIKDIRQNGYQMIGNFILIRSLRQGLPKKTNDLLLTRTSNI